ncbi:MAG TPA: cyclic nucleotide-binding domain-containing protein, partial [Thermoanaerobaculia bacterium]|nr:cyclic nucleotide-binding domain-containing protein [Thermoanaerobaculia bacterium]
GAPPPIFDIHRTAYAGAAGAQREIAKAAAAAPPTPAAGGTAGGAFPGTVLARRGPAEITFLAAMDFNLPRGASHTLGAGDLFGEIGAMSGWPQSVTARTASECTLVQIRVPALRLMRRRSPALKERLDAIYRRQSLADQLEATPLFAGCGGLFLDALKEVVELVSCEPDEVIAREGEPADALFLVRSGFVKLAQGFGAGDLVVNYLSKGMTLGEVELLVGDTGGWTTTASSVEFAELIKIRHADLHNVLRQLPQVEKRLWESAVARLREAGASRRNIGRSEFIETALEEGLVQGNSILVIDLEACTRCDDCVRACAATHEGRPRFLREGEKYGNLQITSACNHCRDPVCLVGCPTGAIRRAGVGHVVAIDEEICIGCQSCAKSCPYDAIVMHPTGETWPADMVPEGLRGKERLVASKCDLCHTSPTGPACVRNCPNGCAYRVGTLEEFEHLLKRRGER